MRPEPDEPDAVGWETQRPYQKQRAARLPTSRPYRALNASWSCLGSEPLPTGEEGNSNDAEAGQSEGGGLRNCIDADRRRVSERRSRSPA